MHANWLDQEASPPMGAGTPPSNHRLPRGKHTAVESVFARTDGFFELNNIRAQKKDGETHGPLSVVALPGQRAHLSPSTATNKGRWCGARHQSLSVGSRFAGNRTCSLVSDVSHRMNCYSWLYSSCPFGRGEYICFQRRADGGLAYLIGSFDLRSMFSRVSRGSDVHPFAST